MAHDVFLLPPWSTSNRRAPRRLCNRCGARRLVAKSEKKSIGPIILQNDLKNENFRIVSRTWAAE
jgi:hypothetical protein